MSLLSAEEHLDRVLEGVHVETAVVEEVLHQVETGQVARGVVDMHVLPSTGSIVDAIGVGRRVPLVDVVSNCRPGSAHSTRRAQSGAKDRAP